MKPAPNRQLYELSLPLDRLKKILNPEIHRRDHPIYPQRWLPRYDFEQFSALLKIPTYSGRVAGESPLGRKRREALVEKFGPTWQFSNVRKNKTGAAPQIKPRKPATRKAIFLRKDLAWIAVNAPEAMYSIGSQAELKEYLDAQGVNPFAGVDPDILKEFVVKPRQFYALHGEGIDNGFHPKEERFTGRLDFIPWKLMPQYISLNEIMGVYDGIPYFLYNTEGNWLLLDESGKFHLNTKTLRLWSPAPWNEFEVQDLTHHARDLSRELTRYSRKWNIPVYLDKRRGCYDRTGIAARSGSDKDEFPEEKGKWSRNYWPMFRKDLAHLLLMESVPKHLKLAVRKRTGSIEEISRQAGLDYF